MKQLLIIAGGVLSLTIMLTTLIAILFVSIFKDEANNIWEEGHEVIETSSSKVNEAISIIEEKRDTLRIAYEGKNNNGSCQQLAEKLTDIEKSLSNGSLILPRSAIEQISTIGNAFEGASSATENIACEQAIQIIDNISQ